VEEGPRSQARNADERGIEILEGLVEAYPGIPDYAYDLSEAYVRMHLPDPPIPANWRRPSRSGFAERWPCSNGSQSSIQTFRITSPRKRASP